MAVSSLGDALADERVFRLRHVTSLRRGVSWNPAEKNYLASLIRKRHQNFFGYHATPEEVRWWVVVVDKSYWRHIMILFLVYHNASL